MREERILHRGQHDSTAACGFACKAGLLVGFRRPARVATTSLRISRSVLTIRPYMDTSWTSELAPVDLSTWGAHAASSPCYTRCGLGASPHGEVVVIAISRSTLHLFRAPGGPYDLRNHHRPHKPYYDTPIARNPPDSSWIGLFLDPCCHGVLAFDAV